MARAECRLAQANGADRVGLGNYLTNTSCRCRNTAGRDEGNGKVANVAKEWCVATTAMVYWHEDSRCSRLKRNKRRRCYSRLQRGSHACLGSRASMDIFEAPTSISVLSITAMHPACFLERLYRQRFDGLPKGLPDHLPVASYLAETHAHGSSPCGARP